MKRLISTALLAGAVAALTLGCDSNSTTGPAGTGTAELQVAHLSPDAPNVDVWLDGSIALPNVPYETFSGYLPIPAGEYRVRVTPAGQGSPVVIDALLEFNTGTATTVAATGLLGAGDVQAIRLDDNRNAGSEVGVRFVHTSPDAPAVDVAVTGGPVLFQNVAFRESQGYLNVAGGTYDLEVRVAGTTQVALSLPGVVLTNGTNVSVYAVGELGNSTLGALVAVDAP